MCANIKASRIARLLAFGLLYCFSTAVTASTVTDIDGNIYQTVTIGTQVWMAENLRVTHYRNGDPIPSVTDNSVWASLATGAYCEYNNDPANVAIYGRIYNWYAVNDSRNMAPEGWHIPTDADWQVLSDYLGGDAIAGGKMKEAGTAHWLEPNTGATNESGFTALPGGWRSPYYYYMGSWAFFWSSTEANSNHAWLRDLHYNTTELFRGEYGEKSDGFSIRCVRDLPSIDPVPEKQTIIDYFNIEPFYITQEQIAQVFLDAVAAHVSGGTATDKEIEALIRLLLVEEAIKAAYKSSEDIGAVPVSILTSKCMQEAASGLFIKLLFTDLEKTLKPLKDVPFLNWFYYAVVDAGKWASEFFNSFNHSVVMQIANRLTGLIGNRSLSTKFAWGLVKEYEEEVAEIALEQVSESFVESKLKELNLWLYETGILIADQVDPNKNPLYIGGTGASLQAGIDDAVAENFVEGNIETTINEIRDEKTPNIVSGNTQTINNINTSITAGEWADQAQVYILLGILIIAIIALIAGILACPASAGIGCILSAISGTGIFGTMLQIQNLLSWAKIVVFTLGAGIGAFQLHANLPNQLWDVKHIAFDQGEKVHLDINASDNMKRYQIPGEWTDSLGAASDSVVNRLSEIKGFVETGNWEGFQGELEGLDSALSGLSSSSSILSSLLGNTYMVNNTDTLGAVDSIMHKAMAHGTETDMALSMTQLALGFASISEPEGPDRDTLLMIIDDCISKLQTVTPAFDSALYDFDTLGFTAPPLVVITDYDITEDQSGKHLQAIVKNIAPVSVNQVVGRLICTDSSMIPTVPESDTLIEMLDSNGEGLFKWRIDTGETDTLFQLELMVEPATAPGDFIGDNRVISLYYPTEEYQFVCGDANWDGNVNLLDILYLISYLYNNPPGDPPMPYDAGNVNSDGNINLLDILYLIQYLYDSPPGPEPNCP